ncbi:MAG: hypothetical protein IIA99_06485, partial [Proteobacteria bacterium]|nr:hypothetical protein [Pseudomonadota bacterium]
MTISGIGKIYAAAATAFTHAFLQTSKQDIWLNVGIAGHKDLEIGEVMIAHKIIEQSTQQSWYPQILYPPPCQSTEVLSCDHPASDYTDTVFSGAVFEMEAAGFYATACRFATSELIHVVKIISDNHMIKKNISKIGIFCLLLITIFSISVFAVSVAAAHTQSSSISPEFAKPSDNVKYAITVTNTEGDDIQDVIIKIPTGYPKRTCGVAPTGWDLRPDGNDRCIYTTTTDFIEDSNSLVFDVNAETASSEGVYTWLVTTRDRSLDTADFQPTTNVDGTAPEVSITFPEAGDWHKDIISVRHEESDVNLDSCSFNVNDGDEKRDCNSLLNFNTNECTDGENTCTIKITAT